jgi:Putative Flp pilus-assembly TadE/G-like
MRRQARVVRFHRHVSKRRGQRGQMIPLVAIFGTVLFGCMALATDLSISTHLKRVVQNVTDAAALAGAKQLPITPTLSDEEAATSGALAVMHNSFPWIPGGVGWATNLVDSGCGGSQCSVTLCAGIASSTPACTATATPLAGTPPFVITVNAPPLTAQVAAYNGDPHRIEVIMHQQTAAFFGSFLGAATNREGAQSIAYHFPANQPFPFALYSRTLVGDGNSPEIVNGNLYASRYFAPQGNGHAAICAAPDSQGHPGFIVLGSPQAPDPGYSGDGQNNNHNVPPGSDPVGNGVDCTQVSGGTVGMSASPANAAGCQAAYPGNNSGTPLLWDAIDQACEANPPIAPPAVAAPPNLPVYTSAQTYCGAAGLAGGVYQKGDYRCASGTSLTVDHQMAPGIYEIDAVSSSGCDVVMNSSTPTTLTGITFYLRNGAGICVNPPSGTTISQTPYDGGSNLPGDGRYAVLADNVGNPTITMSTAGGGSGSGTWNVTGVIWLPTGTVSIGNRNALVDSGQVIVNTWLDTSGYHPNPSISYNANYALPQTEVLQLSE